MIDRQFDRKSPSELLDKAVRESVEKMAAIEQMNNPAPFFGPGHPYTEFNVSGNGKEEPVGEK